MIQGSNPDKSPLSTMFFDRLLSVITSAGGSDLVAEFSTLKRQREQFLQEQWSPTDPDESAFIFREIDFEYLLTSLKNSSRVNSRKLTDIHLQLAESCLQFGELHKAYDILIHVYESEVYNQGTRQAFASLLLGRLEAQRNQWDKANQWLQEALSLSQEHRDVQGTVSAHINLGILTAQQWNTESALHHFELGQQLLNDGMDDPLGVKIQINMAIMQGMRGEFAKAAQQFSAMLEHSNGSSPSNRIHLLINYGMAVKEKGDWEHADEILSEAVQGAKALPNTRLIGLSSLALAEVFIRQSRYDTGQQHLVRAFKSFSQLHDRATLADTYRVFGILYREMDYPYLAGAKFEISIQMNQESGNLLNLTETHYEYSLLAKQQQDITGQKAHLEKSLTYAEKMEATPRIKRLKKEIEALPIS